LRSILAFHPCNLAGPQFAESLTKARAWADWPVNEAPLDGAMSFSAHQGYQTALGRVNEIVDEFLARPGIRVPLLKSRSTAGLDWENGAWVYFASSFAASFAIHSTQAMILHGNSRGCDLSLPASESG
jgi:hypothetical protein